MTRTQVKICGIKDREMMAAALAAGADYIGLVFFARSPRNVSLDVARDLATKMRGRAKSVALTVDADDTTLRQIAETVRPDMIQLHGRESRNRVKEIRELFGIPVIKAVKVGDERDAADAVKFETAADLILFDARPPSSGGEALPGGNGVPFDWQALASLPPSLHFMLSGGLSPDTVAVAIRQTGARAVDVSSGVERAPGIKDAELIKRFVKNAKAAHHA